MQKMTDSSIKIPKLLIDPQLTKIKELLGQKTKMLSPEKEEIQEAQPKDISTEVKKAFTSSQPSQASETNVWKELSFLHQQLKKQNQLNERMY